jgi:acyl transferase domain-containing protein
MSTKSSTEPPHAVAIVGMAGRFPASRDVEEFWQNLRNGRDCISRLTTEELLRDGVEESLIRNERFVPAGGVLDDIDLFDAEFFGISPREAESMDPQQRIFLEVVLHALEDAGCDPDQVKSIGVYAGSRLSGYWLRLLNKPDFMKSMGWHQVAAGNDKDFLATQISFRFNLRGPSVNVQAACSTSLLATALACDALILRQCDVAVAGAASVAVPQKTGYVFQQSGIASPDGLCRPFDAGANGSVLGNGVAAVVLKRVEDAIADGDRIYATIRSTAVNNDGGTKSSFAAPSIQGQADVVAEALKRAGVKPHEIDYIEAHGTATSIGDPMEVAALARVFGNDPLREKPCGIGSVKGNVGHLDPAAGVTALIKVALALHHNEIPPSIHFEQPNPAINFDAAGMRVVNANEHFPSRGTPRRCGVSSFGIGGTNVHAVLEEAPPRNEVTSDYPSHLLILSAKSDTALAAMESGLADNLAANPDVPLEHVAFTLATGRRQFSHRRAVVAGSREEAVSALSKHLQSSFVPDREVFFLFPGQGTQRIGMGRELYRHEPVFRDAIDAVAELASPYIDFDLHRLLTTDPAEKIEQPDVEQTEVAQPVIFAVDYALAQLWMSWGIRPDGMLGHSLGELVAACVARVMSLEDAVMMVCRRGQLMQKMSRGAMLAVYMSADEARAFEDGEIRLAALNAPKQQTLSGSIEAIDRLAERLATENVEFRRLRTSHAFHHRSMEPASREWLEIIRDVKLNAPDLPFLSNVTGDWITPEEATAPEYWASTLLSPVKFSACVVRLLERSKPVFIECGPGTALAPLILSQNGDSNPVVVSSMAHDGNVKSDLVSVQEALGAIWQAGVEVSWANVWKDRVKEKVSLPSYPFQRKRYWIDGPAIGSSSSQTPVVTRTVNIYAPSWQPAAIPARSENQDGTWLVLSEETGLGSALCDRLKGAGNSVVEVKQGTETDDIERLISELDSTDDGVRIVNCWTIQPRLNALNIERANLGVEHGFIVPLAILQAVARSGRQVLSIDAITSRLFRILPDEVPDPTFAPALGLTRVLPQEMTRAHGRLIDIEPPASSLQAGFLIEQLASEIMSEASGSAVVAYRGGVRLIESFDRVTLPPATALKQRIRKGATYVITGGFGGMGGVLAKLLASSGNVQIVLIGRRGLEDSGKKLVAELEAAGAKVITAAVDVSDPKQTERLVQDVQERFGRIDGVIHTAGIAGGGLLASRTADAARNVFAPKVQGTIAMIEAVLAHRPDFFVLCSSFAAVAGGPGQADYCAANSFLDAVAAYGRAIGLPITTINWPAWRDVGMAASMTAPRGLEAVWQSSLASGITPAEGAELFASIVASELTQVIIPPLQAPAEAPVNYAPPAQTQQKSAGPAVVPTDEKLETVLETRLANVWSQALGLERVEAGDNFFGLGGHSLMALQIVSNVREQFPIKLDLIDILETPTLREFAELVQARLVESVSAMPEEKVTETLKAMRAGQAH